MTTATETKRVPFVSASIMGMVLTLTFADGRALALNAETCSEELRRHAMMHGYKQKLMDAAAISRNPETGRSATVADKYEAVRVVYDRLTSGGAWNATREGGAGNAGGLLFKALCRIHPAKSPEALREYLAGKTPAEQAALRTNPKISPVIAAIRDEQERDNSIDTDSMLDELDSIV